MLVPDRTALPLGIDCENRGKTMKPEVVSVLCRQGGAEQLAARGPLFFAQCTLHLKSADLFDFRRLPDKLAGDQ